jgi:hypothetical protein
MAKEVKKFRSRRFPVEAGKRTHGDKRTEIPPHHPQISSLAADDPCINQPKSDDLGRVACKHIIHQCILPGNKRAPRKAADQPKTGRKLNTQDLMLHSSGPFKT